MRKNYWLILMVWIITACLFAGCDRLSPASTNDSAQWGRVINHALRLSDSLPSRALPYLDSAYKFQKQPGIDTRYTFYNFKRSFVSSQGDQQEALRYADSALAALMPVSRKKDYNLQYASACLGRGEVLFQLHRYDDAYYWFFKGKSSLLSTLDSCKRHAFMSSFCNLLGDISYGQSRFSESAEWQKQSAAHLAACSKLNHQAYKIQGIYDNAALAYTQAGMLDSAIRYYRVALSFVDTLHNRRMLEARGVILGNLGYAYYLKGNKDSAANIYLQSISLSGRSYLSTGQDAQITRIKLAQVYYDQSQLAAMDKVLQTVRSAHDTLPEGKWQLQYLKLQAALMTATGHDRESHVLLNQALTLAERQLLKQSHARYADFGKAFALLEQRSQLDATRSRNRLATLLITALISAFILTLVIVYLVFVNNKRTRQHAGDLTTQNKRLETALAALEESAREKNELIHVVAHDLRNPAAAIRTMAGLMTHETTNDHLDTELPDLIRQSSDSLIMVIDRLLSASVQDGQKGLKEQVKVGPLLEECVGLLRYQARQKKQRIILHRGPDAEIMADRYAIWRVVNNLIVNALKFSREQQSVNISWKVNEHNVIISVADKGIGIPKALHERIFDHHHMIKRKGTAGEPSFGLGLYITRNIILEHDGQISFDSTEGKGTTFYLSIPLSVKSDGPELKSPQQPVSITENE